MKNIEKGSVKHLIVLIITISVFGIVLYPLFDLIYAKIITNSEFVYNAQNHIIKPVSFGFILGIILWMIDKNNK